MKLIYKHRDIRSEHLAMHEEDMANDPIYRDGFASQAEDKNPHPFPTSISHEGIALAIEDELTDAQKRRLQELGKLMDEMPWSRWSHGHYSRWDSEWA